MQSNITNFQRCASELSLLKLGKMCNNQLRDLRFQSYNQFIPLLGRGPYHRVAGGFTSTPKQGHEAVRVGVEPRSLAVQLAASHPSPPTTPSPPPENEEDKEEFHKDP